MNDRVIRPRRRPLIGVTALVVLLLGYLGANFALTHSFTRASGLLFVPFFLLIVTSNWLFLVPGPSLRLTPDALEIEGWGLLIRPTRYPRRDLESFGSQRGNLLLTQRDKICWRFRPGHPLRRGDSSIRLPSEPHWDRKIENIYGETQEVVKELETWRQGASA